MQHHTIILGLGSNIGNRNTYIYAAVSHLCHYNSFSAITEVQLSSFYETPPLLPENAPSAWNLPYCNAVLTAKTLLSPYDLLTYIKMTEAVIGRKQRGHWGPREIDIDILAYDNLILDTPTLTIPHKEMEKRPFVMIPLKEIAPYWKHPARKDQEL